MPTLPLPGRLAKALEGTPNLITDEDDSHVTFTRTLPEPLSGGPSAMKSRGTYESPIWLCPRQDSNLRNPL